MSYRKMLSKDGPAYCIFDYSNIFVIKKEDRILKIILPERNLLDIYLECTYGDEDNAKIIAFASQEDAEQFCKNHLIDYTRIEELSDIPTNKFYMFHETYSLISKVINR